MRQIKKEFMIQMRDSKKFILMQIMDLMEM